jgi:hypothetical protein
VDFGRKSYIELLASKDPAIKQLVEQGYDFVTNAFTADAKPAGVRVKVVPAVTSKLKQDGFLTGACQAYNEVGDPIPGMQSIWRKRRVGP